MKKYASYIINDFKVKIGYEEEAITELKVSSMFGNDESGERSEVTDAAVAQLKEYFEGTRKVFEIDINPEGTVFQKQVWDALLKIPYGETRSYAQIAEAVGNKNACRAVGMANNKNPIAIIIPCHRVIGSDGSLTGYAGGLEVKRKLLEIENVKNSLEK